MTETTSCPGCDAELTLPFLAAGKTIRCPNCRSIFKPRKRSSPAVTAARPVPKAPTEDHELFEEPRQLVPLRSPSGTWFGMVARLALAVSVGAFAMPVAYLTYDAVLFRWLAPGIHFHPVEFGRPQQPPREMAMLMDHAFFWIEVTTCPALLAFAIWLFLASHNARLLATGIRSFPGRAVAVLFLSVATEIALYRILLELRLGDDLRWVFGPLVVPVLNAILIYITLQELWRASDPNAIKNLGSWQRIPPSWLVRVWGLHCLAAPLFVLASLWLNDLSRGSEVLILLASLTFAMVGILLIIIIRSITQRQRQRYTRLYEDPA